jgi:hypothetical protein
MGGMTITVGTVLALVVLLVDVVLMVTGAMPVVLGLLVAGLAGARLLP